MAGASDILLEIAEKTRKRIEEKQREKPLAQIRTEAEKIRAAELEAERRENADSENPARPRKKSFIEALKKNGMSYICEVKKASPSKGLIAEEFPYLQIAKDYEAAGASAISCLTEPFYFKGSDRYLKEISDAVNIPVLRKDFTISEYMIYEAKILGASAVLLICSLLDDVQLRGYMAAAEALGMDALVEAHDSEEVLRAIAAGAKIIGVNNRNLRTFEVDMGNSIALRSLAPDDLVFVSESGIRTAQDIERLRDNNVDAVLIGETLMRSADKRKALEELNGGPLQTKIKICGLSRHEDIEYVNEARPDFAGFVIDYPKSRRSVGPEQLAELADELDDGIAAVGVFVDAPEELAAQLYNEGLIKVIQLHGSEDDAYIERLRGLLTQEADADKVRIIKAFKVNSREDLAEAQASSADMIMLDQGRGEGKAFDWSIVNADRKMLRRPFFLAGGLGAGNLEEAVNLMRPWAVDMSSSLETDGFKDKEKIAGVMRVIRTLNG